MNLKLDCSQNQYIVIKLLAFTDTHGDEQSIATITNHNIKNSDIDVFLCCGDFSFFEKHYEKICDIINNFAKPMLFIAGNHESSRFCNSLEEKYFNFSYIGFKTVSIDRISSLQFIGIDAIDEFNPHEHEDSREFESYIKLLMPQIDKKKITILLTHYPPCGMSIDGVINKLGSKNISKIIDEINPDYILTGHFHEQNNKQMSYNGIKVINPGNGTIITI